MTLKEQIAEDVQNLFFDTHEHAQTVNLNGVDIVAVPEFPATGSVFENADGEGVLVSRKTYFFRAADLAPEPVSYEEVLLNGASWVVEEVLPYGETVRITFFRDRA